MNKDLFLKIVEDPANVSLLSCEDIKGILHKYPFFQTGYLLNAKLIFHKEPEKLKGIVQLAATYAADRSKLYELIHQVGFNNIPDTGLFKGKEGNDQEEKEISEEHPVDAETVNVEEINEGKQVSDESINEGNEPYEDSVVESTINNITTDEKRNKLKDHIAEALSRQVEEVNDNVDKEYIPENNYYLDLPVTRKKKQQKNDNTAKEINDDHFIHDEDLFELDSEVGKLDYEKAPAQVEPFIKDEIIKEEPKKKKDELIDKFINSNPKIVPREVDEEENSDISEQSVEENEGYITDTLAKIYVRQGSYSKAIFAYEKLILKYPEKKAYFASQIEEIKKMIN